MRWRRSAPSPRSGRWPGSGRRPRSTPPPRSSRPRRRRRPRSSPAPSRSRPSPACRSCPRRPATPPPTPVLAETPAPAAPGHLDGPAVPVYGGPFGAAQATRLLWRAGFGPRPGDVAAVGALSVGDAVRSLTRPSGPATLAGPEPHVAQNGPAGPRRPLRPRPPVVAGPDGPQRPAAGRADDARLARLVRDLQRLGRQPGADARPERDAARQRARARSPTSPRRSRATRRCSTFLNGIDNHKRSPNENYARELMELFTLGADRGAYTETDVRELARALTGWRADWNAAAGRLENFRFDPALHDTGAKTVFGQTGNFNCDAAVGLCVANPYHRSFFVRKLWSYFIPSAPDATTQAALEAVYVNSGYGDPRRRRGDPHAPRPLPGRADGQVPGGLHGRAAARVRPAASTPTGGTGGWTPPASSCSCPPNVAGWNDKRVAGHLDAPGPLEHRLRRPQPRLRPGQRHLQRDRDRGARRSLAAQAFLGNPPLTDRDPPGAAGVRRRRRPGRRRLVGAGQPARPAPERAAPPDRQLPRPAGLLMSDCGCSGFTRSEMLRRGLATPGAGLPSIEPGMPLPAGTGMSRRSLMLRGAGLALAVYGADRIVPQALRGGHRRGRRRPGPAGPDLDLHVGRRRRPQHPRPDRGSRLPAAAPDARARPPTAPLALSGSSSLRWHPAAAGLKALHDAGKVAVAPAIGYDHPNQSHFTSRHFWEVGQLSTTAATGWLGRYLDRYGAPNNPIQGLSLDGTLSPALATASVAVAAAASPTSYTFDSPGVWDNRVKTPMLDAFGALGGLAAERSDHGPGAPGPGQRGGAAQPARADADDRRRHLSEHELRQAPAQRRPHARRRAAAAGRHAERRRRLRHALQPGRRAAVEPPADERRHRRVPGRPRGPRPRRPRPDPPVERVRAAPEGERLRAPTTARPARRS